MFFVTFFFTIHSSVYAATYYVRADGAVTAANKANATDPSNVATSLNMAQVKLASFVAGDQVLFSSQGGNYTAVLTLPSGGSGVGTEINYANVTSETPLITVSTGIMVDTNSKSNIKVQGFSMTYTGVSNSDFGVVIRTGSNITLKNLTIDMGGYGRNISSGDTISKVLIDSVVLTNCQPTSGTSLYLYGTGNSDITVSNSSTGSGNKGIQIRNTPSLVISNITSTAGIWLDNVTGGTISNVSANGVTNFSGMDLYNSSGIIVNDYSYSGSSPSCRIRGTSNNIIVNRLVVTSGSGCTTSDTANNITINDSTIINAGGFLTMTGSHDITYNRDTVQNSVAQVGFQSTNDSYNITLNDTISDNAYGYATLLRSHDVTYNRSIAKNSASFGFSSTDNSYNVTCNNCKADNNLIIGFYTAGSANNIQYWYSEASYNGTIDVVFNGAGFLPHGNATNVKCYYCIAHHNYTAGIGDVSTGTNLFYNTISWANGNAVGDTFNGSVVTIPSTRGNIYMSSNKSAGSVTIKNTISGQGKPREITNAANSAYTILDYNLYYPLDNSKFFSTDEINDTSWTTYHSTRETHSLNANPLFADALNSNFVLLANSPAIDAGIDLGLTRDFVGTGVPYGSAPDIGAYEYTPPVPGGAQPSYPTYSGSAPLPVTIVENNNVISLVNAGVFKYDAYFSVGVTPKIGSFRIPKTNYWQAGSIYEVWWKSWFNDAKILPSEVFKPFTLIFKYDISALEKSLSEKRLRLAYSTDTKTWKIIPSTLDTKKKQLVIITKNGGYYMLVSGYPQTTQSVQGLETEVELTTPEPTSTPTIQETTPTQTPKPKHCIWFICW